MLVLSRKQNERIVIGESVVVTVVRISGDKVRVGIEAPAEMRVVRDEIVDRLYESTATKLFSRAS
ncbi:MAG: carbon storage regulator [Planctomycetaceae bacterium]